MKKFMQWLIAIVFYILIFSIVIGTGYIATSAYLTIKDSNQKLEEMYLIDEMLFESIIEIAIASSDNKEELEQKIEMMDKEASDSVQTILNLINQERQQQEQAKRKLSNEIDEINKKPSYEYLKSVTIRVEGHTTADSGWIGTGTVVKITEDFTYILTNKHVAPLKYSDIMYVIDESDEEIKADVVKNSAFYDLSLIRVVGKIEGKQAVKGIADIVTSEKVYSVGMYRGLDYMHTQGTVSGQYINFDNNNNIVLNMPSAGGCSGSGVFDKDGKLVAVIWGGFQDGIFAFDNTKAICIPSTAIKLFLKSIL